MKTYGVIMAGGGGTRFWPMSRKAVPKQLLNLSGKDLMVNDTIDRFEGIVEKDPGACHKIAPCCSKRMPRNGLNEKIEKAAANGLQRQ